MKFVSMCCPTCRDREVRMRIGWLCVGAAAVLIPVVAMAQEPTDEAPPDEAPAAAILEAIALPEQAQELREDGVPAEQVAEALEAAESRGLSASEAGRAMRGAREATDEHGPVDNFGAFVTAKLDEGLRGQDLAAAIRTEHEQRGRGKPDGAGKPADAG